MKGSHLSLNFETFVCSGKNLPNFSFYFPNHKLVFLQVLHHSSFVKFLMSILKEQVNCSSNFASFLIVMTHYSSVNFKLIHFLLLIKGSSQSLIFEAFECSGKNLANSSCHFTNHDSGFLQILHHSLLS